MVNRQQRRATERDPRIKNLSKRFAEDFTNMAVGFFEPLLEAERRGENVSFSLDEASRKMFEAKGAELGKAIQQMMGTATSGIVSELPKKPKVAGPKITISGKNT